MSLASRVNDLATAVATLIKGRQPLSTVLTDISGRSVGASASTSLIDRAAGDVRYVVTKDSTIVITINGNGSAITPGVKGEFQVTFPCTITGWTVLTDQVGSAVLSVTKNNYAGFPTTTSITSSSPPTVSSARKATSSTLTGWTTAVAADDVFEIGVTSASTVQRVTLILKVRKV